MTEADLCSIFLANLEAEWKPYPECCGYDLVIVHTTGVQIGIEAKLKGNIKVLDQILPGTYTKQLPHYLGVLLPSGAYRSKSGSALNSLLKKIKVIPLTEYSAFPVFHSKYMQQMLWEGSRLELPSHAACVVPGCPSPKTLSTWKIQAIRLDFLMLQKGRATAKQFREHGQDGRRWVDNGWAKRIERGIYCQGPQGPMLKFKDEAASLISDLYRIGSDVATEEVHGQPAQTLSAT